MKQYYIYLEAGQTGPLTFEELKQYKITSETMVWHEGLTEWQKANTLEEFKPLLTQLPPPILKPAPIPPPLPAKEAVYNEPVYEIDEPHKVLGIRKNIFRYCMFAIILIISLTSFTIYQNDTSARNRDFEIRIRQQEKIAIENQIKDLSGKLNTAHQNLEKAKRNLNNATAFQLLRSSRKRHKEISAAEDIVMSYTNEINALESEMKNINPDWIRN